jgi:hypothetical protein
VNDVIGAPEQLAQSFINSVMFFQRPPSNTCITPEAAAAAALLATAAFACSVLSSFLPSFLPSFPFQSVAHSTVVHASFFLARLTSSCRRVKSKSRVASKDISISIYLGGPDNWK